MLQVLRVSAFAVAAIITACSVALSGQAVDPMMAIQQKLKSEITLTKVLGDRSDILKPGTVVELRVDGLLMYGIESPLAPSNTYKNGKIGQGISGFGKDFAISMMAPGDSTASDYPHRKFVASEKVWVTSIAAMRDGVLFQLYSDPYDNVRYYANLKVPYPNKKEVPSVDAMTQTIDCVFAIVPPTPQSEQAAAAPQEVSPVVPAQAPLMAIVPPPPPADAAPPTIAIGQTTEQVSAELGQPTREAKLGPKEIFYYKDMKVTFTGGKVSNVE